MNITIPFLSRTKKVNNKPDLKIKNTESIREKESALDTLIAERSEYIRQLYCYYDMVKEKR